MTTSATCESHLIGTHSLVPLVQGGEVQYVNLDYAASAPALRSVAQHVAALLPLYSSVHRGAGYASRVCTEVYESARTAVAGFVGAHTDDVVIFTRNTTDALNLLAAAVPGDTVTLDVEHHANLLPWHETGGRAVGVRDCMEQTLAALEDELRRAPAALLAVTGASNVTGECLPLDRLGVIAHRNGARLAVDGAQLAPHRRVDMVSTGVDYLAFSGHKLYAPYGAGVLIGPRDWLDAAPPHLAGGGAVREVGLDATTWADSPARHEGGSPNVLGAAAIAAACRALSALPAGAAQAREADLLNRLDAGLAALGIRPLRIWPQSRSGGVDVVGIATFVVPGYSAAHVAAYLSAEHGIGVRDGRFCAHPLLARLTGSMTAVRASLGLDSDATHVDRLLDALAQLIDHGPGWTYEHADGQTAPLPETRRLPTFLGGGVLADAQATPCSTAA